MLKQAIISKLQAYTKAYFVHHPEVRLVVVVGSVGKTSTKHAIVTLLSQKYRVRVHEGNYNSEVSAPLAILGIEMPSSLKSPFAWLKVLKKAKQRVSEPTDIEVIVQELGTDHPGDIAAFGKYLKPDLAIVTAVTPEHMEFFGSIEAVAREELSVLGFSESVLVNQDNIDKKFLVQDAKISAYGLDPTAAYHVTNMANDRASGFSASFVTPRYPDGFSAAVDVTGEHSLRAVVGAVAVAERLGLTPAEITEGLAAVKAVPGRMNMLKGVNGMTVIDDSYNSSPAAVAAALQTLYSFDGPDISQRIAVLGDMRELGATSQAEHEAVGNLCDPTMLSWVVTVGPEMEKYAVPVAIGSGCQVYVARDAISAGEFVQSVAMPGAVILVKGSQNTIYLEECVKLLVEDEERHKLVRQSPAWQATKRKYFASLR